VQSRSVPSEQIGAERRWHSSDLDLIFFAGFTSARCALISGSAESTETICYRSIVCHNDANLFRTWLKPAVAVNENWRYQRGSRPSRSSVMVSAL
jgi:hypothetical protein